MNRTINSIIIHCTATDIYAKPEDIRNYHLSLGWKDCGYHYLIDFTGKCYYMRPVEEVGAHCKGHNYNSIGIALIGGKDRFDFSFDQVLTLIAKLRYFSNKFRIPKDCIFNHYDFNKNKSCPMFKVQNLIMYEKGFYKKDLRDS